MKTMLFHPATKNSGASLISLCSASFFAAVFLFLSYLNSYPEWYVLSGILLIAVGLLFIKNRYAKYASFMLAFFLLGTLYAGHLRKSDYLPVSRFMEENSDAEAEIVFFVNEQNTVDVGYASYDATLLFYNGKSMTALSGIQPKIRISSYGNETLNTGDVVRCTTALSIPESEEKDGYSPAKGLLARGIFISAEISDDASLVASKNTDLVSEIRKKMSKGLSKYILPGKTDYRAAISKCMLLGDTSDIDRYLEEIFRKSGISHVLCVSGLHLSVLFGFIYIALGLGKQKDRRRFPASELICCLIALAYMTVAGFTPSIMRAGLMLICTNVLSALKYYILKLRREDTDRDFIFDSLSSLCLATVIVTLISPYSLYDVGFQLSFASCLGIILFSGVARALNERIHGKLPGFIVSCLTVTASAVSFTFVISGAAFGTVSGSTFIANLLIAPLATPLLVVLLLLALASLLSTIPTVALVCKALGVIASALADGMLFVAEIASRGVYALLDAPAIPVITVLFVLLSVGAFLAYCFGKKKLSSCFCCGIFLLFSVSLAIYFVISALSHHSIRTQVLDYYGEQYVCVEKERDRVYIDDGEYLVSLSRAALVLGDDRYITNNFYLLVPTENTSADNIYFNITHLNDIYSFSHILLPCPALADVAGLDRAAYKLTLERLSKEGFRIRLYQKDFSVNGIEFCASADKESTLLSYRDTLLAFTYELNDRIADKTNEAGKSAENRMIFYEKKAKNMSCAGLEDIYIQKRHTKELGSGLPLPLRSPVLLK